MMAVVDLKTDDLVFVYGALRSGTTVFRLMLDAHPQIANPGEMDFLFDHLIEDEQAPGGWSYNIETLQVDRIFRASKLKVDPNLEGLHQLASFLRQLRAKENADVLSINIHRNADRLLTVLPNVRIVHMLRDPRDVARSSISMGWAGTLYHGVAHWISTETVWDNITNRIDVNHVFTLTYEALFEETEPQLRKVCAFLGIAFNPSLLCYHKNTTYSAPDRKLVRQWQTKCDPDEIAFLEHRASTLMKARGYVLSGPRSLKLTDRIRLGFINKTSVWRFGAKRFGASTYFGEKITRKLGLNTQQRALEQRMQDITIQHLK